MDEFDSRVGGPVDDPLENVRSRGNSKLIDVGFGWVPSFTRRSREGGEGGGVSLNDGDPPESMLILEEINPLLLPRRDFEDCLEDSRFHDPLILDILILALALVIAISISMVL